MNPGGAGSSAPGPTPRPTPHRGLTVLAVGILSLDGILLLLAGVWNHQAGFVVGGVVLLTAAGAVLLWWYRFRRLLGELDTARREARAEAEALRELLHRRSTP